MSGLSQFYPNARQLAGGAGLAWTSGTLKCLVMTAGYVPNFSNVYLSDIPGAAIIATSPTITNPTNVGGVLSGDTINFGVINDTRAAGSLIFYKDTGNPATSLLLVYVDTPDVAGFPQVLNGYNYYVYKNVVGGWFQL
jgi:hypothetical protein